MSKQMSKDIFFANFPTDQMTNAHPAFSARPLLFHFITKVLVGTLFYQGSFRRQVKGFLYFKIQNITHLIEDSVRSET